MKFFKGILLILLTTILFISSSTLLFIFPLKKAFTKDNIKNLFQSIEVKKIVESSPKLEEEIHNLFEPVYKETRKLGIDDDFVINIIDSKEVKGIFGDITGNIATYAITGENQKLITTDDLEDLVSNAIDDINNSGFYEVKTKEKEQILKTVKSEVDKYQDSFPDTSFIEKSIDDDSKKYLDIIQFILGNKLEIYATVIMILSILLIMLLKWKKAKWIKWSSVTIGISSFISLIISSILLFTCKNIFKGYDLSLNIISHLIKSGLKLSLIVFIIMFIINISYIIAHKLNKTVEE